VKHSPRLVAFVIAALSLASAAPSAATLRKAPKQTAPATSENFGLIPPPVDLATLRTTREMLTAMATPPASWDWRTLGGVTSVKNQNPYGTCWVFAGLADLESKVRINEQVSRDYSELNIVACNPKGTSCNSGGNAWITTNYLSLLGTVNESCNPYPAGCPTPTCINPACPYLKRVREWRLLPNDVTVIKNAIMTYGPVYTPIYAGFSAFADYRGVGCLVYNGTEPANHAVLIVGWDDAVCGGVGGWICKNSYGTMWGQGGYFTIRYGCAQVGQGACVYTRYEDYDSSEKIYHYDDRGWESAVGFGDRDDYGMVAFTPSDLPPWGGLLEAVDFWATGGPTTWTVEIYDDFDGSSFSGLLAGPLGGTKQEAGYYSVALENPLTLHTGDTVYIKMRFNTPNYVYPVPCDDGGPMETNKSFVSDGPNGPWTALDAGSHGFGDIGIRARVTPTECSRDGDPVMRYGWRELDCPPASQPGVDYAAMHRGESLTFRIGPGNAGETWMPPQCKAQDTLCCHVTDTRGWSITGNPPLGLPKIVSPGYFWTEDVTITASCSASVGQLDTVIARVVYTDIHVACASECFDCNDPNIRAVTGVRYYSSDTLVIEVVETPERIAILQDTLTLVDHGQSQAFIPFSICNADPCAGATEHRYRITSRGRVGAPIDLAGSVIVAGGYCKDVYGVVDASAAPLCAYDTLTIVAWSLAAPVTYDTCVEIIHVVEPQSVPLLSRGAVAAFVAAMLLVAARVLGRRARGVAT